MDPKPISKHSIPRALEKAERYRLLNEPGEAQSICRDVLRADPGNQQAMVMLLLATTDQFGRDPAAGIAQAREALAGVTDPYEAAYYTGVMCERWAKSRLRLETSDRVALGWLGEAMEWFEKAEALRPSGNDDALLRWNACVRLLRRHGATLPAPPGPSSVPHDLTHDDDVPPR
jgi:hypothetical protein